MIIIRRRNNHTRDCYACCPLPPSSLMWLSPLILVSLLRALHTDQLVVAGCYFIPFGDWADRCYASVGRRLAMVW